MAQQERMTHVFRRIFVSTWAVAAVLVLVYVLYRLRAVAFVLAVAGLLAYLLSWPIERLAARWPRWAAVTVVFITFLIMLVGLFGAFVPILTEELGDLINAIPGIFASLEAGMGDWVWKLPFEQEFSLAEYVEHITAEIKAGTPAILANAFDFTRTVASGTATVLGAILIVPLITLYFLLDSARLKSSLLAVFDSRMYGDVDKAIEAVNRSLGSYIYSRVLLGLFVGTATTAILLAFGVKYAVLLGLLAFVGEFVPVIGPLLIAYVPLSLIVIATENWAVWFWVTLFFIAVQLIENYLIAPKLIGDTMDLHPLTVILAMMVGGTLGGIGGLLVAIPVAAALKVIFSIFIFRQNLPGVEVPRLDIIGQSADAPDNLDGM